MNRLKIRYRRAEDSPGFMLWKASNLLQRLHTGCLKDLGVTPTQFSIMTCLLYLSQNGPVTPSLIVAHTGIDKMTVSDLIKTLIRKKLVTKSDNPDDRRSFLVEPSQLGETITNSAIAKVEAVDTRFFDNVRSVRAFHADLTALVNTE